MTTTMAHDASFRAPPRRGAKRVRSLCEWTARLLRLNLIMVVALVAGLIVFSVGPTLTAGAHVSRQWRQGELDLPVARTFLRAFRDQYRRAVLISTISLLVAAMVLADVIFLSTRPGQLPGVLIIVVVTIGGLASIVTLHAWPVLVRTDRAWRSVLYLALLTTIGNPVRSLGTAATTVALVYLTVGMPIAGLCLTVACWTTFVSWNTDAMLDRLRRRADRSQG